MNQGTPFFYYLDPNTGQVLVGAGPPPNTVHMTPEQLAAQQQQQYTLSIMQMQQHQAYMIHHPDIYAAALAANPGYAQLLQAAHQQYFAQQAQTQAQQLQPQPRAPKYASKAAGASSGGAKAKGGAKSSRASGGSGRGGAITPIGGLTGNREPVSHEGIAGGGGDPGGSSALGARAEPLKKSKRVGRPPKDLTSALAAAASSSKKAKRLPRDAAPRQSTARAVAAATRKESEAESLAERGEREGWAGGGFDLFCVVRSAKEPDAPLFIRTQLTEDEENYCKKINM